MADRTRRQSSDSSTSTPQQAPPESSGPELSNQLAQEQISSGLANYTDAFGERIGTLLWEQVSKHVTDAKLDELLHEGGDSAADWLYEQVLANVEPGQVEELRGLKPQLREVVQATLVRPAQDSGFGPGLQNWAAEHPRSMAGLGLLGAGAYIASNPELEGDVSRRLGENHEVSLGGEFGRLFDPSVDSVRGGYGYQDSNTQLQLQGEHRFDKDQWSLAGAFSQQTNYGIWSGHASHVQTGDESMSRGGLGFANEDMRAHVDGSYDSENELGRLQAGFSTLHDSGPNTFGSLEADTTGAWNANLGVSKRQEAMEWFATVGGGQDEHGETDLNAMAGFKVRF